MYFLAKGYRMDFMDAVAARRTVYALNKELPVAQQKVTDMVKRATELVPDAFNMRSQRVVIVQGAQQDALWDAVYDAFDGKVAREKIDGFKAGAGTVLYFIDTATVKGLQDQFPTYAANFPVWAQQSNGMLQFTVWTGLRELGVGANLQHYNPVIDDAVRALTGVPESYQLVAQMVYGGIVEDAGEKPGENISDRVTVIG